MQLMQKLIVDDNSLGRQGIAINRDLTEREREAEKHGFSFVELEGTIGVIGNGAGLTMSTLDLIEYLRRPSSGFPRCRWRSGQRTRNACGPPCLRCSFSQGHCG